MFDQTLRLPKRLLLEPIAKKLNLSPSIITVVSLLTGLSAALCICFYAPLYALGLWFLNRILDGLDGEIARLHNRQSDLGAYFDMMADLLVYAALPLSLVWVVPSDTAWLSLAILLSLFYINLGSWMYLSSLLEKRGLGAKASGEVTSITMPTGIIEGTETIVFYTLFLLLPSQNILLFYLMSIFIVLTIIQRLVWAKNNL